MCNTIARITKTLVVLILLVIGVTHSFSTARATFSSEGTSTSTSIITSQDEQNNKMSDVLHQAEFNSNSSTSNRHQVLCTLGVNGTTGDYIICKSNQTDLPCLPQYHECVNQDDLINPCNMSCLFDLQMYEVERERMSHECPMVDHETKSSIRQIKFWADGVSKVVITLVLYVKPIQKKSN